MDVTLCVKVPGLGRLGLPQPAASLSGLTVSMSKSKSIIEVGLIRSSRGSPARLDDAALSLADI